MKVKHNGDSNRYDRVGSDFIQYFSNTIRTEQSFLILIKIVKTSSKKNLSYSFKKLKTFSFIPTPPEISKATLPLLHSSALCSLFFGWNTEFILRFSTKQAKSFTTKRNRNI